MASSLARNAVWSLGMFNRRVLTSNSKRSLCATSRLSQFQQGQFLPFPQGQQFAPAAPNNYGFVPSPQQNTGYGQQQQFSGSGNYGVSAPSQFGHSNYAAPAQYPAPVPLGISFNPALQRMPPLKILGFIRRVDTGEQIYVSNRQLRNKDFVDKLKPGQFVLFSVGQGADGNIRAIAVNVLKDRPSDNMKKLANKIVEKGIRGTVKSYSPYKRYGFVTRSDNGQDVFVHAFSITKKNPEHAVRSLGEGEEVEFDIADDNGKFTAINVSGPGGSSVRGSVAVERVPFLEKLTSRQLATH